MLCQKFIDALNNLQKQYNICSNNSYEKHIVKILGNNYEFINDPYFDIINKKTNSKYEWSMD